LLATSEELLRKEGLKYLQVKTLDVFRCCQEYARTRFFYEAIAMVFHLLELYPELWDKDNPFY